MDGAGFKVKLSGRSLASGECRIKLETVHIVFGEDLVPLEGVSEVSLTLTDAADNSRWQASLRACGHDNKYCWISGLQGWMQHNKAKINDKLHVNREAQGALYLRLDPGAASDTPHVPNSSSHERTEAHGAPRPAQHASAPPPPANYIKAEDIGRSPGVIAASDSGQLPAPASALAAAPLRRAGIGGRGWERVDPAAAAHQGSYRSRLLDTAAHSPQLECMQQQEQQRVGGGGAEAPNQGGHPGAGSHGVVVKVEQEDGHAMGLERQQGAVAEQQQGLWTFGQHDQEPRSGGLEQQDRRQQEGQQWPWQGQEGRQGQGQEAQKECGQGCGQSPHVKQEGPEPRPTGVVVEGMVAGADEALHRYQQDTPPTSHGELVAKVG